MVYKKKKKKKKKNVNSNKRMFNTEKGTTFMSMTK